METMDSRIWVLCGHVLLQEQKQEKKHMFNIDWSVCSKYVNHTKLNNRHNWGTYITINEHASLHFENG